MNPNNIEVSEIQAQLSSAEQEAAVQYANGQPDSAIDILVDVIKAEKVAPPPTWLMLFDLFRVQGRWADFDNLSKRYAALFGRPAPEWLSEDMLPDGLPAELKVGGRAHCEISGELGPASAVQLAALWQAAADHPVVHIDLTKISGFVPEGCTLLVDELRALAANGNGLMFSGAERIEKLLRHSSAAMPKVAPYWQLLLELYRLQGKQKPFESAALDYALSIETDPPAWEPVLLPVLPHQTVAEKRDEPRYHPEVIHLTGEMVGLKEPQLAALQRFAADRQYVNVNMARLNRIDFVCAGSLANILAALKKNGKTVRCLRPNFPISTLLRMLKVDENASIVITRPAR
jgi:ABC-type transporter Mla MlaB component